MISSSGREVYIRWFFESSLGEQGQLDEDAVKQPFSFHSTDLIESIERGSDNINIQYQQCRH